MYIQGCLFTWPVTFGSWPDKVTEAGADVRAVTFTDQILSTLLQNLVCFTATTAAPTSVNISGWLSAPEVSGHVNR